MIFLKIVTVSLQHIFSLVYIYVNASLCLICNCKASEHICFHSSFVCFSDFPDHFDESKLFQGDSAETKKLKVREISLYFFTALDFFLL